MQQREVLVAQALEILDGEGLPFMLDAYVLRSNHIASSLSLALSLSLSRTHNVYIARRRYSSDAITLGSCSAQNAPYDNAKGLTASLPRLRRARLTPFPLIFPDTPVKSSSARAGH